jgi:hypothetical protein
VPPSTRHLITGPQSWVLTAQRPKADDRSVAVALVRSGTVRTIAIGECDRPAAGAVPQNRAAEFGRLQNRSQSLRVLAPTHNRVSPANSHSLSACWDAIVSTRPKSVTPLRRTRGIEPVPGGSDQPKHQRTPRDQASIVMHDFWDDGGMDSLANSERFGLPVACTLGAGDGAHRMQRWEALSLKGRPSARRCGHQLVVAYRAEPGVREELEALVAAERQCCSFVAWDVSQKADRVVLRVAADPGRPDDVAGIAALFAAS